MWCVAWCVVLVCCVGVWWWCCVVVLCGGGGSGGGGGVVWCGVDCCDFLCCFSLFSLPILFFLFLALSLSFFSLLSSLLLIVIWLDSALQP